MKYLLWAAPLLFVLFGCAHSGPQTPFNEDHFRASHNSYAAGTNIGPITHQLDAGLRFVELDIHDADFAAHHDYRLGHLSAGQDLLLGHGNPDTPDFAAWLQVIRDWSDRHPGHAPITLGIDIKNDLTRNPSFDAGNLGFLNAQLEHALGPKLFTPDQLTGPWPATSALRDRILVVLSGDLTSRTAYRWDLGRDPAVAMNEAGQILEVHESASGALWYWTGQYQPGHSVRWLRHGRYGAGHRPAVQIATDGSITEVHTRPDGAGRLRQTGHWTADGDIAWDDAREEPAGADPVVPAASAVRGALRIEVFTGSDGSAPEGTLLYRAGTDARPHRVRYQQIGFVEYQRGNPEALASDGLEFFACSFKFLPWGLEWRQKGKVVRLWQVTSVTPELQACPIPPANFPATDTPYADWYEAYCRQIQAVR